MPPKLTAGQIAGITIGVILVVAIIFVVPFVILPIIIVKKGKHGPATRYGCLPNSNVTLRSEQFGQAQLGPVGPLGALPPLSQALTCSPDPNGPYKTSADCTSTCTTKTDGPYKMSTGFGCVSLQSGNNELTTGDCYNAINTTFIYSSTGGTIMTADGTNRAWSFNSTGPITVGPYSSTDPTQNRWVLSQEGKIFYFGGTTDTNRCISINTLGPILCSDPSTVFSIISTTVPVLAYSCQYGQ